MSIKYSLFRKVSDKNLLKEIEGFLIQNEIVYQANQANEITIVYVASHQMLELEKLMLENNELFLKNVPDDFYLQGFSEKELLDIIMNPEDWSAIDYHLSVNILAKKRITIDTETLANLRKS